MINVARRESPAHTGVWVGIATITMSFAAYTSALMVRQSGASDWQHLTLPSVLYANTVLLALSSVTLEVSRRWLRTGETSRARGWIVVTSLLGFLFVSGQVLAWRQLSAGGLYLATTPSSSFFYILTALHAMHLAGGLLGLGYIMVRLRSPALPQVMSSFRAVALYWHFMGALWLYLLLLLIVRL